MQKTKECRCYNQNRSYKKAGGVPKTNNPASGKNEMIFAQLICTETKNAVCSALKKIDCGRKCHSHHEESDSNSDSDY